MHDKGRILVALLREGVELRNRVIKGLLCEVAGTVGRVEDFVVEDGEVEGEAETDGVCWGELGDGDVGGGLVGLERLVGAVLALVAGGKLSEIAVVVTHPVKGNKGWA